MTGGYGCIGSWVAKQLVEAGREVWIYDLKEDTHRLDLILEPEQRARVHFVAGDVSDADAVRIGRRTASGRRTSCTWRACRRRPAGPTRSWVPRVNVIGTLAVFEAALALKDRVRAGRLRQLGGRSRPGRAGAAGRVGDEVRLAR